VVAHPAAAVVEATRVPRQVRGRLPT
jgi:hypothetical protein